MANFYVSSAGSNTSPFDTWAKAATDLLGATALVDSADDRVYCDEEVEAIVADKTYALTTSNAMVLGTNDLGNEPPLTEGTRTISGTATNGVDITITGSGFIKNHIFLTGASTAANNLVFMSSDGHTLYFENCQFWLQGSNANNRIQFGSGSSTVNTKIVTKGCTFVFNGSSTSQGMLILSEWVSIGDTISITGTQPATLLLNATAGNGSSARIYGMDLSTFTGTIIGNWTGVSSMLFEFYGCKRNASATRMAAQTSEACAEAHWYDCNSGDVHYNLEHDHFLGTTTISTSIYANAGATYDGSTHYSWVVAGSANATYQRPYRSPWMHAYNSDVSTSVTPRIEALRDGSATKYNNDEVWGEWSYKGSSGFPLVGIVDDRRTVLAAAAAQATSALGASDWTGENATAAFMKLEPSAFTPAEIGWVGGRVAVGGNFTVYVDPKIYGISTVTNANYERVTPSGWINTNMAAAAGGGLLRHPGMTGGTNA